MDNLKAVILDDDEFMLNAIQAMLESMGVHDIEADTSASRALHELDMHNPRQVLLCDLNMPNMDGVEVIRHLGQGGFKGSVVVLSGEDGRTLQTAVNIGRTLNLQFLGALSKPVDRQELQGLLEQIQSKSLTALATHSLLSEAELRNGLIGDALTPYFQPQVDARSGRLVGMEALARWRHPTDGMLGPGVFISVAEESDLIAKMTEQMLTRSMRQWRAWHEAGVDLDLSVNISMRALSHVGFPDWLVNEAQAAGVPLKHLVLEITESQPSLNAAVSSDVLARLCLKRIRLSIDDFGTAYSSMEKLQMLPFHELKIDKAFVHGASSNMLSHSILKSSVELGRNLGMRTVAEGVESQEDWDNAVKAGVDLIQGYFVAAPMQSEQVIGWLQQWKSRSLS